MKGYNVRMALVVSAAKKHAKHLDDKGDGIKSTRAYRLQGLSNDKLIEFFNMSK